MSLTQTCETYYRLSCLTKDNMHIRKTEFLTEVILSLFVVIITIQRSGNPSFAVGAIAVIHSLNVARAFEAYKEAQVQQSNIGDYND